MSQQHISKIKFWGFMVILALLVTYWAYSTLILKGSAPYYRDYDPEMAYFMNSLAIFKGMPYFYTDHPGTPIEVLGTILLGITYPFFTTPANFIQYHLQNPELFLNLAHILVTFLSIGCAIFFFFTVLETTPRSGFLIAISLALMFYGLHAYAFTTLTIWSHTAFNFPLGTLYLLTLFKLAQIEGVIISKAAIGLGFATGIMTAVMVNFLPWLVTTLVFVLLFYRLQHISWKQFFLTSTIITGSSAVGFFLTTLPAMNRLFYFFGFIQKLITHQLPYGNGPAGITTVPLLLSNFLNMIVSAPVLFASILIAICVSVYTLYLQRNYISKNPGKWAFVAGLTLQLFILIALVAKHPGERFLLPLATTVPVLFLAVLDLSKFNQMFNSVLKKLLSVFSIIGISYFAVTSLQQKQMELIQTRSFETQADLAIKDQARLLGRTPEDLIILWSNVTYSYCPPRLYGDFYASDIFAQEIDSLCPNQAIVFFHLNWVFYHGEQRIINTLPWDLLVTRKELLAGNPKWEELGIVWEYPDDVVVLNRKK